MPIYSYNLDQNLSEILGINPSYNISLSDQKIKQIGDECKQQTGPIKTAWEGNKHTEESKQKISSSSKQSHAYRIGSSMQEEIKQKISSSLKGRRKTKKHNQNVSAAKKGIIPPKFACRISDKKEFDKSNWHKYMM